MVSAAGSRPCSVARVSRIFRLASTWRGVTRVGSQPSAYRGSGQDTCICRARDIHVYLVHLVMLSKVGERMSGIDFMTFSST
jgi:hypothetical protein